VGGTKGDKKVKGRLDLHYEINSSGYALHYTFCTVETKFMAKWKKK
jgi:hypothetical protein